MSAENGDGFIQGFGKGAAISAISFGVGEVVGPIVSGSKIWADMANAGIHTAIAGGITYGADALINNSAFNWKAYGLNIANSMAMAGLSHQKPAMQYQSNMLGDLRAAGIESDMGRGFGMRFDNPPGADKPYGPYELSGIDIVDKPIYIIKNGQKINWSDVSVGTNNMLSMIVDRNKSILDHNQANNYLLKMSRLYGNMSQNNSRVSWVATINSFISKELGPAGFTFLQLQSELNSAISNEFGDVLESYMNDPDKMGLYLVSTRYTRISAGTAFHTQSFEFYRPNGSLYHLITF